MSPGSNESSRDQRAVKTKFAACQGEAPAGPVGTVAIHDQLGLPEIDSSDRDRFSFIEKRRTRKNGIGEGLQCNGGRPAGLRALLGAVVAVSPRRDGGFRPDHRATGTPRSRERSGSPRWPWPSRAGPRPR